MGNYNRRTIGNEVRAYVRNDGGMLPGPWFGWVDMTGLGCVALATAIGCGALLEAASVCR